MVITDTPISSTSSSTPMPPTIMTRALEQRLTGGSVSELFSLDPGLNSFRAGFAVGGLVCGFGVVPPLPAGLVEPVELAKLAGLARGVVPLAGLVEVDTRVVIALLVGGATVPPNLVL